LDPYTFGLFIICKLNELKIKYKEELIYHVPVPAEMKFFFTLLKSDNVKIETMQYRG